MSTRTVAIIGGSYVGYRLATTLAEVLPATYQLGQSLTLSRPCLP